MTRHAILSAALLIAVPAAAQDAAPPTGPSAPAAASGQEPPRGLIGSRADPQDFDLARKKVVDCEGQKFVFSWGAGSRPTKVTLCSKKDASAAELVTMLDDAATKLERTASIAEDRRIAIVQQIRAKIAEIKAAGAAAPANRAVAQVPTKVPPAATFVPAPTAPVFKPGPVAVAVPRLLGPKPRLSFECYTPGELGSGGPCTTLGRDTRLTVKAGEQLAGGTTLRFRRYGETRAEVALTAMRKGQSVRLAIPRQVCGGVVEAEIEIQVARGASALDTRGPFLLRC